MATTVHIIRCILMVMMNIYKPTNLSAVAVR